MSWATRLDKAGVRLRPPRPGRLVVDGGATAVSGGVGGGEGGCDRKALRHLAI